MRVQNICQALPSFAVRIGFYRRRFLGAACRHGEGSDDIYFCKPAFIEPRETQTVKGRGTTCTCEHSPRRNLNHVAHHSVMMQI
jgi:hypothetical protein